MHRKLVSLGWPTLLAAALAATAAWLAALPPRALADTTAMDAVAPAATTRLRRPAAQAMPYFSFARSLRERNG